jgi:hypothetical protein
MRFNSKLYKEDNSLLRTVVSIQLQHTETRELEDTITKPLPSSGRLWCFSDCTVSDVMSCHV